MTDDLTEKAAKAVFRSRYDREEIPDSFDQPRMAVCREAARAVLGALDLPGLLNAAKANAWDEGFKQGGPMHDVNYDDPDAHTRNPYRLGGH